MEAGRSPLGPVWLPAKTVRVRALPDNPRRFDMANDEVQVVLRPGATSRVFLDLRPRVTLQSVPEPARVIRTSTAGDSVLGETPLGIPPSLLDHASVRLTARDHADTTLDGESLTHLAQSTGSATVSLRRVAQTLPPRATKPPVYRRRWVQLTMIGVGAALTGASALFRREGDRWYDRYLESSDRDVLDTYFDRAVRYDHYSLVSLGVGQVLFTGGVVLLVGGGR